jgi:hypothetical protein
MAFRREVKLIFLSFSRFQHNKTLEATSEKKGSSPLQMLL